MSAQEAEAPIGPGGLASLFRPRNLAVFGASRSPEKWGRMVIDFSLSAGFDGRIYAINPRVEAGLSDGELTFLPSLDSVDERIDLAVIALPARLTPDVVAECARADVATVVLAASGFGELGERGLDDERRMRALAAGSGMRMLGPNGFGLFVSRSGLNLTPVDDIPSGSVGFATQSGNVAIDLFGVAARAGLGFSSVVGVGNQIDIGFADLLEFYADDPDTRQIAMYLEGLPVGAGPRFRAGLTACREAGKPVVVLKAGRSERGGRTAATHTGSLAADDRVWNSVLRDEGAIRVDSTHELVDVLSALTLPRGPSRIMVFTDGGGDSVMAVDAFGGTPLTLAEPGSATRAILNELAPPEAPRSAEGNPVTLDTAGGLHDDPMLLARCVEAAAADPGIDTVMFAGVFGGYTNVRAEEIACVERLIQIRDAGTALVVQSAFAEANTEPMMRLRAAGVPVYPSVTRMVNAMALSASFEVADRGIDPSPGDGGHPANASLSSSLLPVEEAAEILAGYGVRLPGFVVVDRADDLSTATADWRYPVCLKVADVTIVHKSDVGGVVLDISTPEELAEAAARLGAKFPGSPLLVMPMHPRGVEFLVGTTTDPVFGGVTVVGRGGIWAETDPDIVMLVGEVEPSTAELALRGLRCAPTFVGTRGQQAVDLGSVARLVSGLSRLAAEQPDLSVDLNPVIGYSDGYAVADLRVTRTTAALD